MGEGETTSKSAGVVRIQTQGSVAIGACDLNSSSSQFTVSGCRYSALVS